MAHIKSNAVLTSWVILLAIPSPGLVHLSGKIHLKFDVPDDQNEVKYHLVENKCFGRWANNVECFVYVQDAKPNIFQYLNVHQ